MQGSGCAVRAPESGAAAPREGFTHNLQGPCGGAGECELPVRWVCIEVAQDAPAHLQECMALQAGEGGQTSGGEARAQGNHCSHSLCCGTQKKNGCPLRGLLDSRHRTQPSSPDGTKVGVQLGSGRCRALSTAGKNNNQQIAHQ